jgi:hypothetical protein
MNNLAVDTGNFNLFISYVYALKKQTFRYDIANNCDKKLLKAVERLIILNLISYGIRNKGTT